MTCWIEDELHREAHGVGEPVPGIGGFWPQVWSRAAEPLAPRPCNAWCDGDTHATVVFTSDRGYADPLGHVQTRFEWVHPQRVVAVTPATEVTPEMYPRRFHHGPPADPWEKWRAWLVHFR